MFWTANFKFDALYIDSCLFYEKLDLISLDKIYVQECPQFFIAVTDWKSDVPMRESSRELTELLFSLSE